MHTFLCLLPTQIGDLHDQAEEHKGSSPDETKDSTRSCGSRRASICPRSYGSRRASGHPRA